MEERTLLIINVSLAHRLSVDIKKELFASGRIDAAQQFGEFGIQSVIQHVPASRSP